MLHILANIIKYRSIIYTSLIYFYRSCYTTIVSIVLDYYVLMYIIISIMSSKFEIKDSGEREQYKSGMVRDVSKDKIDYSLVLDGPLFQRLAEHLTKGAKKYNKRNWLLAGGQEELDRFKESSVRHFFQWYRGDLDEDHFAATIFNLNAFEHLKNKLNDKKNR